MLVKIFCLVLFLFMFVCCCTAARILAYFPTPSISHQVVFRPLMQELARRGHELVIITPDPAFPKGQAPENITEIDVHDLSYSIWVDYLESNASDFSSSKAMQSVFYVISQIVDKQIQTEEVQELIARKEKFDLIFLEAYVLPSLEMIHIFQAPSILFNSFGSTFLNHQMFGVPQHFLLYPELMRRKLYNVTLWEKIQQLYEEIILKHNTWNAVEDYNEVLKNRWGQNATTIEELVKKVDMMFLNVHSLWDDNRPVPPGVIHFNALHLINKPQRDLPKDLKTYLDSSVNGVIYMSLGTNAKPSFLPSESLSVLMKVFSRLPYDILLKWDKDLPNVSKNVKVSKWFPQADLLKHPKIKLFITQAGLQSTDEAIVAGVPLIAFPMMGDQWYDAEKYVYYKIGIKLDMTTITEEVLTESIMTVIKDESYRRNVATLRILMYDQPQRSLERAVWWTEYVIRHRGAKHYRSPAADTTWSEFLMLDVVITLLLASIFITISIIAVLTFVLRRIYRMLSHKTKIKIN